jgi:ABC-2 type transport system ATP-binding protein
VGLSSYLLINLRGKKGYEIQHVLKDMSFEIKKGEFFGIVGRNGSGKSTLIKAYWQVYIFQTKGLIQ